MQQTFFTGKLYQYDFHKLFFFIWKRNLSFSSIQCFHVSATLLDQLLEFSSQSFFGRIHILKWKFLLYDFFHDVS